MATTLSQSQLDALVIKARAYLRLSADSTEFSSEALAIYNSGSSTTATLKIEDGVLSLTQFGGGGDPVYTPSLSDVAYDTIGELVTYIDGLADWSARLLGNSAWDSTELFPVGNTSVEGFDEELTLLIQASALLEQIINQVYGRLERFLRRDLYSNTRYEYITLNTPTDTLVLTQPDVTSVLKVQIDYAAGLQATYSGSNTHARIEVTDTAVVCRSQSGESASETENILLFATYENTTTMAAAIQALGGWTGVGNTLQSPSENLVRTGSLNAKDQTITLDAWVDWDGDMEYSAESGTLRFYQHLQPARRHLRVRYVSGFATLPADVEGYLMDGIKAVWDATQLTGGVTGERLGDYSYTRVAAALGAADDVWMSSRTQVGTLARVLP